MRVTFGEILSLLHYWSLLKTLNTAHTVQWSCRFQFIVLTCVDTSVEYDIVKNDSFTKWIHSLLTYA